MKYVCGFLAAAVWASSLQAETTNLSLGPGPPHEVGHGGHLPLSDRQGTPTPVPEAILDFGQQ